EYTRRTRIFTDRPTPTGMPFYLMSDADTYRQVGGPPNSAGVFMQRRSRAGGLEQRLMAFLQGDDYRRRKNTWRTVQHEGFHQFSHLAIGGRKPAWMEEGLAEYFECAEFCGDGFVIGLIPPIRVTQLQTMARSNQIIDFNELMTVSRENWNGAFARDMNLVRQAYLQSWSMVHFLIHADGGRWVRKFEAFLKEVQRGIAWTQAWLNSFGRPADFAQVWGRYWANTGPDATKDLYVESTLRKLTSFYARSTLSGDQFDDFATFFRACGDKQISVRDEIWLPPGLLDEAIAEANEFIRGGIRFDFVKGEAGQRDLVAIYPNRNRIVARYVTDEEGVREVLVRYVGG
ncbi:MAG: DUF1570 domain-containing protein, partial [Planctomycetota bacterium]